MFHVWQNSLLSIKFYTFPVCVCLLIVQTKVEIPSSFTHPQIFPKLCFLILKEKYPDRSFTCSSIGWILEHSSFKKDTKANHKSFIKAVYMTMYYVPSLLKSQDSLGWETDGTLYNNLTIIFLSSELLIAVTGSLSRLFMNKSSNQAIHW